MREGVEGAWRGGGRGAVGGDRGERGMRVGPAMGILGADTDTRNGSLEKNQISFRF